MPTLPRNDIPRPEHPRPQFHRNAWLNLNGPWTFDFDFDQQGIADHWQQSTGFDRTITVPFCPESQLSGVEHTGFIPCLWYHRTITIPDSWADRDILLHCGGCDYHSEVFIDGRRVGQHHGTGVGFTHNITPFVTPGQTHHLVIRAADDTQHGHQPLGKQSQKDHSYGCFYTRTTGIWQTVWLEAVHPASLEHVHILPDVDQSQFTVTPTFRTVRRGLTFHAQLRDGEAVVAEQAIPASQGSTLILTVPDPILWQPGQPHLYDLTLEVRDGDAVLDRVDSYAGLRKIHVEGDRVFLNNQLLYQRLVLDQGFYPDGIWTAPSDEALKQDIELAMAAGFNGARLHQKVFEERFHYWADKLGYLTWAESHSWGGGPDNDQYMRNLLPEWLQSVVRDRNHPSIIAWTPLNETWRDAPPEILTPQERGTVDLYNATRMLDPTRPINDASGWVHWKTDLYTTHDYSHRPEKLRENQRIDAGHTDYQQCKTGAGYEGQPFIIDEFGGIKWHPDFANIPDADRETSWGYGQSPRSLDEFYQRLEGQIEALLSLNHISGYCYTQLTDVEQEQNGIYFYDRSEKFDLKRIHAAFSRKPAWAEL